MIYNHHRQLALKQYARLVLALFVVSLINLAIQQPLHAAMLSKMEQSQMTGKTMSSNGMGQGKMTHSKMDHSKMDAEKMAQDDMAQGEMDKSKMPGKLMGNMAQSGSFMCECPPAMCETIDSLASQNSEKLSLLNINLAAGLQLNLLSFVNDDLQQISAILLTHIDRQFRQSSPSPLTLKSVLHI